MRAPRQVRVRQAGLAAAVGLALLGLVGVAPNPASAAPASVVSSASADGSYGYDDDSYDDSSDDCDVVDLRDDSDDDCPAPPPPPPPPPVEPPPPPPPAPPAEQPALLQVAPILPATVFDGILSCGDVASQEESIEAAGVAVKRLDNADGSECDAVPYTLTSDQESLQFLKTGSPYAQFIATVEWRYELEPPTKTTTYVDFELVPGGYELTMPSCPAAVKKNGKLVGLSDLASITPASLLALGITDMDGLPRLEDPTDNGLVQYACVGSRSNRFVNTPGDEHYLLTEQIYILGDIFIRR